MLVQPNAEAAAGLAAEFEEVGYQVVLAGDDPGDVLEGLEGSRPYAIVVFLDHDPPAALRRADLLFANRKLRGAPLLFAGGTEDALADAEEAYPRASFTRMEALQTSLASIRS